MIFLAIFIGAALYLTSVIAAALIMESDFDDAAWWPIHLFKALAKSLYRALTTEWKP